MQGKYSRRDHLGYWDHKEKRATRAFQEWKACPAQKVIKETVDFKDREDQRETGSDFFPLLILLIVSATVNTSLSFQGKMGLPGFPGLNGLPGQPGQQGIKRKLVKLYMTIILTSKDFACVEPFCAVLLKVLLWT